MTISLSSQFPKPDKSNLLALLVSEKNLSETKKLLRSHFNKGISIDKEHCSLGKQTVFSWESTNVLILGIGKNGEKQLETLRKAVFRGVSAANKGGRTSLSILIPNCADPLAFEAMAESVIMSNYQFLVYKSKKKENSLTKVQFISSGKGDIKAAVKKGEIKGESACVARDLVNEPLITLTAPEIAKRAKGFGKKFGFSVKVIEKKGLESLKMGGILAVNFGSPLPPTFTIMEWKPSKPKNSKPIVLVGKGVVYDTGGLSLKPTAGSMDFMKSDMAGAACVIGAMCGLAQLKSDYHVIGLVPATDNRPGQNAYVPGDVIKMYDGSTVEVLNTDAEGRMLLADALAYAKQYKPEVVVDLATLTGAAVVAVGEIGIAMMSTASKKIKGKMELAGEQTHERVVELPLWEEYGELLKSDIADMKNIGGRTAGSITAGKFLEHFTSYPWIHLDIAGPSFLKRPDSYRGKNGTGHGVRILLNFIENY